MHSLPEHPHDMNTVYIITPACKLLSADFTFLVRFRDDCFLETLRLQLNTWLSSDSYISTPINAISSLNSEKGFLEFLQCAASGVFHVMQRLDPFRRELYYPLKTVTWLDAENEA